jgi:ParB-like chromosome segregation protein Spo0J
MHTLWTSRIVGHDRVDPATLIANPYNPRTHPPKQREALEAAIKDVGFIRSVTVNRTTGRLIDGHERVWQAVRSGQPTIDVEYVELSEEAERKALATLDRIGELAEIDPAMLDGLLRQFETGSAALQAMLAEFADEAGLYRAAGPPEGHRDPLGKDESHRLGDQFRILITCEDEQQQTELLERLTDEGLECRALIA